MTASAAIRANVARKSLLMFPILWLLAITDDPQSLAVGLLPNVRFLATPVEGQFLTRDRVNIESNSGRILKPALSRVATRLVQEAKRKTGLSYPELDQALDLPSGTTYSYCVANPKKSRAPQASAIQRLEERVARLVGRKANILVVRDMNLWMEGWPSSPLGVPSEFKRPRTGKRYGPSKAYLAIAPA